jgi:hypothetical protein
MLAAALAFAAGAVLGACAVYLLLTRPSSHEDMADDWRTTGESHAR